MSDYLTVFFSDEHYMDSHGNYGSNHVFVPQHDVPDYPFAKQFRFNRRVSWYPDKLYSSFDEDRRWQWSINFRLISRDTADILESIFSYSGPIMYVYDPYDVSGEKGTHVIIVEDFKKDEVIFDAFNVKVNFAEVEIE